MILATLRRSQRRPEVTILAGMTGCATVTCTVLFLWPSSPQHGDQVVSGFAVLSGLLTLGLCRARHVPAFVVHLIVAMWLAGTTVAIVTSPTPQGAVGTALTYTWTLLYTAYFFSAHQARVYAAVTGAGFLVACIARPYPGIVAVWITVTVTCVAGCELLIGMLRRLRTAALQDVLTGQRNRAALVVQGAEAIRVARRHHRPLTVAVLDLDHFKKINDEGGHAAGDDVLRVVTQQWSRQLRPGDTLYRSGGDEFVLLLPDTREPEADALLRRLRDGSATGWCFGIAEVRMDDDLDMALARADLRLYAAKGARPRVALPTPRRAAVRSSPGRPRASDRSA